MPIFDNTQKIKFIMKTTIRILAAMAFVMAFTINLNAQNNPQPVIGHWDITVDKGNNEIVPSWLDVKLSGFRTLAGHFVSAEGSARPISKIQVEGNKFSFSIPPQWEMGTKDLTLEGTVENNQISGTITYPDGKQGKFTGSRAPGLHKEGEVAWGEPIKIFNGTNLEGWVAQKQDNQWVIENGILKSPRSGSNLMTTRKFQDFKLHAEFRYPKGSNSGIYLRGRYELQIIDSKGQEPASILFGGIYGFLTPNEDVAKDPGEWQTYDITLIGRQLTVEANGKTIICRQIIPGITGGALDSNEGEPGPILLQGDHGPVEFRNIVVTPAK